MEIISFFPFFNSFFLLIGEVGDSCYEPSWWQYPMIASIVIASGAFVITSGVGTISIVITLVELIIAGASLETISASLAGYLTTLGSSAAVLVPLINSIKDFLRC